MLVAYMRLGVDPNMVIPVVALTPEEMGVTQAALRGQGFVNTNLSDGSPVTSSDYYARVGFTAPFGTMSEVGTMGA